MMMMKVKKNVFNQDRDCNYALASWLVQSLVRLRSHQVNSLSLYCGRAADTTECFDGLQTRTLSHLAGDVW